jgi:hypothetical protein
MFPLPRIALGYGLDDGGFESRQRLRIFLFTTASRLDLGPNQPKPMRATGSFPGVKRPGVKMTTYLHIVSRSRMRGAIPPLPQYAFMARCSVKKRGGKNFPFYFTFPFLFLKY